jgi:HAD superfamily hydrolase (TIGR01509 family)
LLCARLGLGHVDDVRTVIYQICDHYPGLSAQAFMDKFSERMQARPQSSLALDLVQIWNRSVRAAVLKPGAWEVLDELRASGAKLALVSNTPPTSNYILDRLKLRQRFDAIVFSCDVGFLKPDPRIFKLALNKLGVPAEQAVVVGDKIRTDILGGAILGMRSVLVEERSRTVVERQADYVDAIVPAVSDLRRTILYRRAIQGACA